MDRFWSFRKILAALGAAMTMGSGAMVPKGGLEPPRVCLP